MDEAREAFNKAVKSFRIPYEGSYVTRWINAEYAMLTNDGDVVEYADSSALVEAEE